VAPRRAFQCTTQCLDRSPRLPVATSALAGSFAALGSLALVNAAGEPIDQPQILLVGTLHPYEPRAHRRDQRRKQNCRGDHGCAIRMGIAASAAIRRGPTIPLIFALSFRRLKQGPGRPRCLWLFLASGILERVSSRIIVRTSALRRRLCDREASARRRPVTLRASKTVRRGPPPPSDHDGSRPAFYGVAAALFAQRDPDHIAALNLLYPGSIQALSGVNSEDQDNDQASQIFQPKGDGACCPRCQ